MRSGAERCLTDLNYGNILLKTLFASRPRLAPVFLFANVFSLSIDAETRMSERDAFTLRLKPDLLQFVKEMAEEENRSIPNFVETVLIGEQRRRQAQAGSNAKKD